MNKYNNMLGYNQIRRLLLYYKRLRDRSSSVGDDQCMQCGHSRGADYTKGFRYGAISALEVVLKGYIGYKVRPIKDSPLNYNERNLLHD